MKKIFSFAIVLCAAAMVSCGGNTTKPAAEATEAPATEAVEAAAEEACCEKCDSTDCAECETPCEKAEGACCNE
jgi:hypothetical protein